MGNPVRVAIIDDHAVLADAMGVALRSAGLDVRVVDLADQTDGGVVDQATTDGIDVVLLDLHLGPDRLALPLVAPLAGTGATVLMLTASHDGALLGEAVEAGAAGIVHKEDPFDVVIDTVRRAAAGEDLLPARTRAELIEHLRAARAERRSRHAEFDALTASEQEVLRALVDGRSVGEIAHTRVVSEGTVRSQVKALLRKLGVRSQLAAVAHARRAGWPPDGEG